MSTIAEKRALLEKLPSREFCEHVLKANILISLAWGYIDTILSMAKLLRIAETRPLARRLREIQREYDRFRQYHMNDTLRAHEAELAENFEDAYEPHFTRLYHGVSNELLRHHSDMQPDWLALIVSVYQAEAVLGAATLYARRSDRWLRDNGVKGYSLMPDYLREAAALIPEFAGNCYQKEMQPRDLTATILCNEIIKLPVFPDQWKLA